ncbi:hypothetical protein D3C81_1575160 [compost metagenome]
MFSKGKSADASLRHEAVLSALGDAQDIAFVQSDPARRVEVTDTQFQRQAQRQITQPGAGVPGFADGTSQWQPRDPNPPLRRFQPRHTVGRQHQWIDQRDIAQRLVVQLVQRQQ